MIQLTAAQYESLTLGRDRLQLALRDCVRTLAHEHAKNSGADAQRIHDAIMHAQCALARTA